MMIRPSTETLELVDRIVELHDLLFDTPDFYECHMMAKSVHCELALNKTLLDHCQITARLGSTSCQNCPFLAC